MENNSQEKDFKDEEQKHSPEDLAVLLDEIDRESNDMTDFVLPEEFIKDNMVPGGEEELVKLDPELFDEEDLELDLEKGEDSGGSSPEIESVEIGSETDTNAPVDDKGEDGKLLAEKEAVSSDPEEVTATGMSNDLADLMSKKIQEVVTRLVEERMSTIPKQSSKDYSKESEEGPALVRQEDVYSEKSHSDPSTNELADLMSNRIEKIVIRKVEEQMPAIAKRTVLEMMKKILLSME